jgi:hypothetical protein
MKGDRYVFAVVSIVLLLILIGFAIYLVVTTTRHHKHGGKSWHESCHAFAPRFINLYNLGAQTGITGAVSFDSQGQTSDGFVHTLGTASILISTGCSEGFYDVEWAITPSTGATGSNQFGIFINGAVVAGSVRDTPLGVQTEGFTTIPGYGGTLVTLQTVGGTSVNLAALTNNASNASLRLTKVANKCAT